MLIKLPYVMFWKYRTHYALPENVTTFWWDIIISKGNPAYKQLILARNFKLRILITSWSYIWNIYQVFIHKLLKITCAGIHMRHQLSHLTVMLCLWISLPLPAAQRGKDIVYRCVQSIIWSFRMPVNMWICTSAIILD